MSLLFSRYLFSDNGVLLVVSDVAFEGVATRAVTVNITVISINSIVTACSIIAPILLFLSPVFLPLGGPKLAFTRSLLLFTLLLALFLLCPSVNFRGLLRSFLCHFSGHAFAEFLDGRQVGLCSTRKLSIDLRAQVLPQIPLHGITLFLPIIANHPPLLV